MKRFYKDERGSSLVLTIIAMAFISLLAVAVISMTVTNIRLKIAQKGSQKNFYNTDSIMDEVRAGVEDMAGQAAIEAYKEALTSFNASLSGTSINLNDKYEKKFLEIMVKNLSGGDYDITASPMYYKDEVLQAYLIKNSANPDRYILHNGTDAPGLLDAASGKTYGNLELQNNTLLLKDVMVTMTEGVKNYKTTLTSDIRVTVPPMTADTFSEYLNYALIADNQIIVDFGSASVEGNMYAGTVRRFTATADKNPEAGIIVTDGKDFKVNAKQVITRGDLLVNKGSKFSLNGWNGEAANLWVENIFTKGSLQNELTMKNTVCNVSDDMEIDGKNDKVTLEGQYLGYNYNANYADSDLKTVSKNSEYSSSIMINGLDANLDMTGLTRLILSGRTFISKKSAGATETDAMVLQNKDIIMGESLSVKGAQLAYYVPSDFVTLASSATSTSGKTVQFQFDTEPGVDYVFDYGAYTKYLFGLDPETATDQDLIAQGKGGDKFNIMTFLNTSQPLEMYYRHDISVESNAVTYYYLNFKDDTQLLAFYPHIKDKGVPKYDTVKDVNAAYMGTAGIKLGTGYCYHSGNILSKTPAAATEEIRIKNQSLTIDSEVLYRYARNKSQEYLSRQLSLVENYEKAKDMIAVAAPAVPQYRLVNADVALSKSGTADDTNLYNLLIDAAEMATRTNLYEDVNDSNTGLIVIEPRASETYVWNSSKQTSKFGGLNSGIIIAAGDVKLEANFSGLIIAGGDIIFAADGVKVSAATGLLEDMFTEDKGLVNPKFYKLFSNYFQKVVDSGIGQSDDATEDTVFYEGWKKE